MQPLSPIDKILSAGMVVIHHDDSRYRFLVLRAYSDWDFPHTLVAEGEDPMAAALRETREATGLEDLELDWGDEHRETLAAEDGSVTRYYIAQSKTMDVDLRLPAGAGTDEDFEYRWVTADEAEEVLPPRLAVVLNWIVRMLVSGAR